MDLTESFSSSFQKNRKLFFSGLIAAILMVVWTAWLTTAHLHRQAEARVEVTTQNLAHSIEQTLEGMVSSVDIALLSATDEVTRQLASGGVDGDDTSAFFNQQLKRLPHLSYLRATNARGDVVYGPGVLTPPVNIADRSYFIRLRDTRDTNLLVSEHLVGRIANKWAWLFVRRINQPDGSFGGVVFAGMLTEQFPAQFAHFHLEPGGSIALRDPDLRLIARYASGQVSTIPIGEIRLSDPFTEALRINPYEGTYVSGETSIDGVSRTHSYKRNGKYGFVVNVGIVGDVAMGEWRQQTGLVIGLTTAFVVASLVFAWLLGRSWRRQEQDLATFLQGQIALKESEERFHSLFVTMSEGVALHQVVEDAQGRAVDYRILEVNPAFTEQTGLAREAVVGKLASVAYGTAQAPFLERFTQVAYTQQPLKLEEAFEPLKKVFLIRVFSPKPGQFATVFEDISEHKRMEKALRQSEARYRMIAENVQDVIWVMDLHTLRFTYISPSVLDMRGYTPDEVMAQPIDMAMTPASATVVRAKLQASLARLAAGETTEEVELTEVDQPHRDGHIIHTEVVTSYLFDADGRATQVLGVTRDVSERKRNQTLQDVASHKLEAQLQEILELQQRLQNQVVRDPLTGLYNRRYLDETLSRELVMAKREGYPLSLAMLDLDHFKRVNDTYGHAAGDEVLRTLAATLKHSARESDIICRYGGEEFLVVLPRMNTGQAMRRVEAWRQEIANALVTYGDFRIKATLSAGVAGFPDHGADVDTLLSRADEALYGSKREGRNRVTHFGETQV